MGLDGSVRCRCFDDGLATPPPFPVIERDGQLVAVEEQHRGDILAWRKTACAHPDMAAADRYLAWRSVRSFRAELARDAGRYPTLLDIVPDDNAFLLIPPGQAATALAELTVFAAAHPPVLMDRLHSPDGERLGQVDQGATASLYSAWLPDGRMVSAGISEGQFAIWHSADTVGDQPDPNAVIFTAQHLRESPATADLIATQGSTRIHPDPVMLINVTTGSSLTLLRPVINVAEAQLTTLLVPVAERFSAYEAMVALCRAAVGTGHPIDLG